MYLVFVLILTDFPWSLQHILPFWAGADHHDFHHMAFNNNFATSFRWCDRIAGTDDRYLAYKARVAAAKKAGLSMKELKDLEIKLKIHLTKSQTHQKALVVAKVLLQ